MSDDDCNYAYGAPFYEPWGSPPLYGAPFEPRDRPPDVLPRRTVEDDVSQLTNADASHRPGLGTLDALRLLMLCGWRVDRALYVLRICRSEGIDPVKFAGKHGRGG